MEIKNQKKERMIIIDNDGYESLIISISLNQNAEETTMTNDVIRDSNFSWKFHS